jgi:hypothetical protein
MSAYTDTYDQREHMDALLAVLCDLSLFSYSTYHAALLRTYGYSTVGR